MAERRFYRPELDALRFVAFLMVFLHHALHNLHGMAEDFRCSMAFGVCLFFLLSAFLITELLDLEARSTGHIDLARFYVRRVLRIWPLFLAVLCADFLFNHFRHPGVFTLNRLLANLLLLGNWYVFLHGFTWTFSTPVWSIAVEEQFYVLWPTVRRGLGRTGACLFSIAVLVSAYVALWRLCAQHADVALKIWVNSFVQFQFFSLGTLLALAFGSRSPRLRSWQRGCLSLFAIILLFLAQFVFHVKEGAGVPVFGPIALGYLCIATGCAALFLSFLGASGLGRYRWWLYLGKITYGLYIMHFVALEVVGVALGHLAVHVKLPTMVFGALYGAASLGLTIALAALSYRFFESPFLRLKTRFETIRTRPV